MKYRKFKLQVFPKKNFIFDKKPKVALIYFSQIHKLKDIDNIFSFNQKNVRDFFISSLHPFSGYHHFP